MAKSTFQKSTGARTLSKAAQHPDATIVPFADRCGGGPAKNSASDAELASVLRDLESSLRELAQMAAIARFYVCETNLPPKLREEERREADRAVFAISHVAEMAEDVERAYHASFHPSES